MNIRYDAINNWVNYSKLALDLGLYQDAIYALDRVSAIASDFADDMRLENARKQ